MLHKLLQEQKARYAKIHPELFKDDWLLPVAEKAEIKKD